VFTGSLERLTRSEAKGAGPSDWVPKGRGESVSKKTDLRGGGRPTRVLSLAKARRAGAVAILTEDEWLALIGSTAGGWTGGRWRGVHFVQDGGPRRPC